MLEVECFYFFNFSQKICPTGRPIPMGFLKKWKSKCFDDGERILFWCGHQYNKRYIQKNIQALDSLKYCKQEKE